MPTVKIFVPRITRKQIREFETAVPGLSTVAFIPAIINEKDARKVGARLAVKKLKGREFIARQSATIKETPEGWELDFKIYNAEDSEENRQNLAD